MSIEEAICRILKGSSESRIAVVASMLSSMGASKAEDLKQYNWEMLESIKELSDEERNKIMKFIEKNLEGEIAKVLKNSDHSRVEQITSALKSDGLKVVDELRFYDWKSLEALGGLSSAEINKIMEFVQEEHPRVYGRHKRRRNIETQNKELSEYKQLIRDFDETISKIFDGCSAEPRIHKVKEILIENGVKRADDLKYFDWRYWEDLGGLTSAEINRIMDFVKEKFNKDYKRHEQRRDEEKRIREELSTYKAEESKQQEPSKLGIEEAVLNIFVDTEASRIEQITNVLKGQSINMAVELKYFERESLQDMNLDDTEINKIMEFVDKNYERPKTRNVNETQLKVELPECKDAVSKIKIELTIEEAVHEIFEGSSNSKLNVVIRVLMMIGVNTSKELKCLDRKSLGQCRGLEDEDIDKIMKFIQES